MKKKRKKMKMTGGRKTGGRMKKMKKTDTEKCRKDCLDYWMQLNNIERFNLWEDYILSLTDDANNVEIDDLEDIMQNEHPGEAELYTFPKVTNTGFIEYVYGKYIEAKDRKEAYENER